MKSKSTATLFLIIPASIIFLCAQGASNVSGYCQAANRAHELSGKLNSHGGAGSSFATQPSFRHNPARTSSQILAQLYDSIYYWVWDTATAAWSTSSIEKDINFTYDIHQNKTGYTHQAWNGSSWDDQVQVQYGFDANNNPTSDLWLYWDGSAWENNFRINRTFNLNNKVAMVQNQSWNTSAWENSNQLIYTYNLNHLTTLLTQFWDGSAWEDNYNRIYTYDVSGNRISELTESWTGSAWENNHLQINTFDANNFWIGLLNESWNGSAWDTTGRYTFTYDAFGNPAIDLFESWNGTSWDNSSQTLFTYDANNNQTANVYNEWDGAAWVEESYYSATYDARNFQISNTSFALDFPNPDISSGDSTHYYFQLVTGIKDPASAITTVNVYPNPVSGRELTITGLSSLSGKCLFQLFDETGREIISRTESMYNTPSINLVLPALDPAVYVLQVTSGDEHQFVRMISVVSPK